MALMIEQSGGDQRVVEQLLVAFVERIDIQQCDHDRLQSSRPIANRSTDVKVPVVGAGGFDVATGGLRFQMDAVERAMGEFFKIFDAATSDHAAVGIQKQQTFQVAVESVLVEGGEVVKVLLGGLLRPIPGDA